MGQYELTSTFMVGQMEECINEIPLVVRNSLKALSDENRQGILMYLLKTGPRSFTEIRKGLNISKNNLSYHIKNLMRYGLIYNFYSKDEFADKYSFYEISKLGKSIITSLINSVTPLKSEEEYYHIKITMTEDINTDADLFEVFCVNFKSVPAKPEVWDYRVSAREAIDASTGLEIAPKKTLEKEEILRILS